MPPSLQWLSDCFRHGNYAISEHAVSEMEYDDVTRQMLASAIGGDLPEVVEDYPHDLRGASCLVLVWLSPTEPVHVVIAYWTETPRVITVYRPSSERWHEDYKTRR